MTQNHVLLVGNMQLIAMGYSCTVMVMLTCDPGSCGVQPCLEVKNHFLYA